MLRIYLFGLILLTLISCESEIDVDLDESIPTLSVDAFINDLPGEQRIVLAFSQEFFDNTTYQPASGAIVTVTDDLGNPPFEFQESVDNPGIYQWIPPSEDQTFGTVNATYTLLIEYQGVTYESTSKMNRVPPVDSILFIPDVSPLAEDDDYQAEFFAIDPECSGDSYWVKAFKNGQFLDDPGEINLAFDAGNSEGAEIDGDFFIVPIKLGINPEDEDESYDFGDSVRVEIHSITNNTFDYMTELAIQTNNEGGFGQLFAAPPSNLRTNILSSSSSSGVLGHFSVSAVSSLEAVFTDDLLRED